jgi:DNA invertase Pin-like site-specific DNA recombinase
MVDAARYLFLTGSNLLSIGGDNPIYAACYLLDGGGKGPRSPRGQPTKLWGQAGDDLSGRLAVGLPGQREELATLLQFLREGDTLVVTRIDRLARSLRDLQNIVHDLRQRGVTLKATEQPIDTSTAAGRCFLDLDMLCVFAEFETNLRKERQMEGVARAKANGVYAGKGRPASIDVARVREMKAQGMGAAAIAKALSIHRASVYRLLVEGSA